MRKLSVLALALSPGWAMAQDDLVVATGVQPVYSITATLAEGTGITVRNLPEEPVPMASLARQLGRIDATALAEVDAVVTLTGVWPDDPLFAAVRQANIRVVRIEASAPLDGHGAGLALVRQPRSAAPWRDGDAPQPDLPARAVWQSGSNMAQMAAIIAADLRRLSPGDAETIDANLAAFDGRVRAIMLDANQRLAQAGDRPIHGLTDAFIYMVNELGLYVDGYFLEPEVNWTEADLEGYGDYLEERGIGIVLHQWQPEERVAAVIAESGAELVVLDPIDPGAGISAGEAGWESRFAANLDRLLDALE